MAQHGVEILSTGGTARQLRNAGVTVTEVADYTGAPEILDGRVKTLHPKIHGGLLGRPTPEHQREMAEHGIGNIDLVVVTLYPFRETVARPNVALADAIENIDIGGPSMLRSAAKNHRARDRARRPRLTTPKCWPRWIAQKAKCHSVCDLRWRKKRLHIPPLMTARS